jgi:hypothetical protein
MAHAIRWQALAVHPVEAVDRPLMQRVEVQVLTPEQAAGPSWPGWIDPPAA